jgi:PAS domain S-box-containing protein
MYYCLVIDDCLLSFLDFSSGNWHFIYGTLLTILLIIIYLIFYITAKKIVRSESIIRQSKEELVSLNQRLNDIIELIPDPTFVIDKDNKVVHWNRAIEELTGVRKEEVLGKSDYSYAIPFYGEKRPMLLNLMDCDQETLKQKYSNIKRVNDKIYAEFSGQPKNLYDKTFFWGAAAPLHDSYGNQFGAIEVIKDITEAKKREIALIESEKKARIVMDTNQDIILLMKTDGTILDCNKRLSCLFDKPLKEIIDQNIKSFSPEQYSLFDQRIVENVLEAGIAITFDGKSSDDSEYYTTTIYPVKNDQKEIQSLLIYAQNTSKLKRAEKALKDSEELYRSITESIYYLYKVVIDDLKTNFIFDHPDSEKILGYTPAEFKENPNLFCDIILPEDRELIRSYLRIVVDQKISRTLEHQICHKNGKMIWISNTFVFYKWSTETTLEINGVIMDITLRKHTEFASLEAEKRYRTVFDQSGLASNVFDPSGRLIMQNALAASMLGGNPYDFIGKKLEEIYPPEAAKEIEEKIKDVLQKGATLDEKEITLPTGKYWFKFVSHPIKNNAGDITGVQVIMQDITEKKEFDRKIVNAIIETEEKERTHFAQELHDGLGPIMSAIKMYVQWMSRPDVKISQTEILSDTENLINDATQTIREISFKLSPHILTNFGLLEAIRTFAERIQHSRNIEIDITSNFADRFEKTTETILYRILCECINNTLKHACASKITISALQLNHELKIEYGDNGIGFRVETVIQKKTGNGLFNMQSRIQSINGSFVINSCPETGTNITINVPLN